MDFILKLINTPAGMTIAELKEWLARFPDKNPDTGEDREVFTETGEKETGPVLFAWPMNCDGKSGDVGLFSGRFSDKS